MEVRARSVSRQGWVPTWQDPYEVNSDAPQEVDRSVLEIRYISWRTAHNHLDFRQSGADQVLSGHASKRGFLPLGVAVWILVDRHY